MSWFKINRHNNSDSNQCEVCGSGMTFVYENSGTVKAQTRNEGFWLCKKCRAPRGESNSQDDVSTEEGGGDI